MGARAVKPALTTNDIDAYVKHYAVFHSRIVALRREQQEILKALAQELSEKDMELVRKKLDQLVF